MRIRRLALAAAVALIVTATLASRRPAAGWESGRFDVCLFCGGYGGLDALNNVLLFLPFGVAAAAVGWRLIGTTLTATVLATAVELIQLTVVTGRYAGIGDILFNTGGALAGAVLFRTRPIWIRPSPGAARIGALAAAAAGIGIAAATAWLLGLPLPDRPLVGEWAPRRAVAFTGELHRATLNGGSLPAGPIDAETTDSFRARAFTGRASIAADITAAAPPPQGVAPIVRLVTDNLVHLAINQSRDGIVFVPALRSRRLGLRTIAIALPAAAQPSERLHIEGSVEPRVLQISADGPRGRLSRRVNLTVGLGWAMLLPFTLTLRDAPAIGSLLWLLVLACPIGFYAAAARSSVRSSFWWLVIPASLVIALACVPATAGIAASGWTEWVGAVSGAVLGAVGGQRVRRARNVHGATVDKWTPKLCPGTSGSLRAPHR